MMQTVQNPKVEQTPQGQIVVRAPLAAKATALVAPPTQAPIQPATVAAAAKPQEIKNEIKQMKEITKPVM